MNKKRNSIKKIVGISAVASVLPNTWVKPVMNAVTLPAHAQTSLPPGLATFPGVSLMCGDSSAPGEFSYKLIPGNPSTFVEVPFNGQGQTDIFSVSIDADESARVIGIITRHSSFFSYVVGYSCNFTPPPDDPTFEIEPPRGELVLVADGITYTAPTPTFTVGVDTPTFTLDPIVFTPTL